MNQKFKKIIKFIYALTNKDYLKKVDTPQGNILISYLSEPFYKINDRSYLNKHQNRRESLIICDVLSSLSYNQLYIRLNKFKFFNDNFDVIFGVEPNFIRASLKNPNAIKIYYATGAYCSHQNSMVIRRTDLFNSLNKTNVPYYRCIPEHNACEIADYIIQIGSKFTVSTYPSHLQDKIILIRQSCHEFKLNNYINEKLDICKSNHFVWMGSEGSILKGLDIVLDYFLDNPNLHVHVIGKVDSELFSFYKHKINMANNIHLYGYLDLDSPMMIKIGQKASFVIMPSASEGCPGSVINMMKLGCIPIVSKYAAFNEINDYGFIIESFSKKSLAEVINRIMCMNENELLKLILSNFNFANSNFNNAVFKYDLENAFKHILKL